MFSEAIDKFDERGERKPLIITVQTIIKKEWSENEKSCLC